MSRTVIVAIVAALVAIGALLAYQAYERDRNTLDISISPNGISVD